MVKNGRAGLCAAFTYLALVAIAAPSIADGAADRYENDWSYKVRPWKREPVRQVTIEASGLGDDARDAVGEPEPCSTFRPSEAQVAAYVARARRLSQRAFLHETDWSACHATGSLTLRSGGVAHWMLQRLGAGYMVIDGRRYYFNCSDCRWHPTARHTAP